MNTQKYQIGDDGAKKVPNRPLSISIPPTGQPPTVSPSPRRLTPTSTRLTIVSNDQRPQSITPRSDISEKLVQSSGQTTPTRKVSGSRPSNIANESPTKKARTVDASDITNPPYDFGVDSFKKPEDRPPRRTTTPRPGSSGSGSGSYTPAWRLSTSSAFRKPDNEDGFKFTFLDLVAHNPPEELANHRQQYPRPVWIANSAYPDSEFHWSHRLPLRYFEFFALIGFDVNDKAMGKELTATMHETLTSAGYDREWYVFLHGKEWLAMFSAVQTLQQTPIPKSGVITLGGSTPKAKREAELMQLRLNGIKVAQKTILDFLHQSETKYEIAGKYQAQVNYNPRYADDRISAFDTSTENLHEKFHSTVVAPLRKLGLVEFVDKDVIVEREPIAVFKTQDCLPVKYPTSPPSPKLQNTNRSRSNSIIKEVIQTSTTATGPVAPKSKQLLDDDEK